MRGLSRSLAKALLLLLLLGSSAPPAVAQCSMCKSVVAQSPEGRQLAGELNKAILLMLASPYLIFGSCLAVVFRNRLGDLGRRFLRARPLPR
jgi:hypothetical protein